MVEYEISSFDQAAEDLYNKARAALHELACYEINMEMEFPKHSRDQLTALRDAVIEYEGWT